jgi:hypothetical protein
MALNFYPSVIAAFKSLVGNSGQEGTCYWMYLDRKGYVTTGKGNLINSPEAALDRRWHWMNGSRQATDDEVRSCWEAVHGHQEMAKDGAQVFGHVSWNPLRLTAQNIDDFVASRISEMVSVVLNGTNYKNSAGQVVKVPGLTTAAAFPADAQLALLRYAWAYGPVGCLCSPIAALMRTALPGFEAAASKVMQDPELNFGTKTLIAQLFCNASDVVNQGLSFSQLLWPKTVHSLKELAAKATSPAGIGTLVVAAGVGYLGYQGYKAYQEELKKPTLAAKVEEKEEPHE